MATATLIPSGYIGLSGMTIDSQYPITNAYANSSSTNYARFNISQSTTGDVYLTFDTSNIPSTATNISITGNFKARVSNTTRVSQTGAQLYSGTTAKGTSVAFGSTTASVRSLAPGDSWTRTELNDLRLHVTGRASSSTSSRRIDFYGADVTITYTAGEVHVTGVTVTPATASIEVGENVTLTAEVSPSDATNKTVTWTTSASSVATVSDGVVTGVSVGTARITATTQDGGYTDYCDVTVTPAVTYEFVPASSMEVGEDYLISIGNSGSIYLLTDESGGSRLLKGAAVTVFNGKITINGATKSSALFSCVRYTAGNDNTITVEKDGKYLYCDNSNGLRMNAPATLDRFWHYRENKFWQFKSTAADGYDDTSSEYKYYLQLSGSNYTDNHVTSPSIEESSLPVIYIWRESTGETDTILFKDNGNWVAATKVYKKVNGSWVEQVDLTAVFDPNTKYVKG